MERKAGISRVKLQSYLLIPADLEDSYLVDINAESVTVGIKGGKETQFVFDSSFLWAGGHEVPIELIRRLDTSVQMAKMGYASTLLLYFPQSSQLAHTCELITEQITAGLFKQAFADDSFVTDSKCSVEIGCFELLDNQIRDTLGTNSSFQTIGSTISDLKISNLVGEGHFFVDGITVKRCDSHSHLTAEINAALGRRVLCIGGSAESSAQNSLQYRTPTELAASLRPELLGAVGTTFIQLKVTTSDTFSRGGKSHTIHKSAILSFVFLSTNETMLSCLDYKGFKAFTEQSNVVYGPSTSNVLFHTPPVWLNSEEVSSRNNQVRNALKALSTLSRVINSLVERSKGSSTSVDEKAEAEESTTVEKTSDKSTPSSSKLPPLNKQSSAISNKAVKNHSASQIASVSSISNSHTDSSKRVHVPFRDSILTRLLRHSLEGNCFLSMVAIPPVNLESASRALRFTSQISLLHNTIWIKEELLIRHFMMSKEIKTGGENEIVVSSRESKDALLNEVANNEGSKFDSTISLMKEEIGLLEQDIAEFERARELVLHHLAISMQPVKSYATQNAFRFDSLLAKEEESSALKGDYEAQVVDVQVSKSSPSRNGDQEGFLSLESPLALKRLSPLGKLSTLVDPSADASSPSREENSVRISVSSGSVFGKSPLHGTKKSTAAVTNSTISNKAPSLGNMKLTQSRKVAVSASFTNSASKLPSKLQPLSRDLKSGNSVQALVIQDTPSSSMKEQPLLDGSISSGEDGLSFSVDSQSSVVRQEESHLADVKAVLQPHGKHLPLITGTDLDPLSLRSSDSPHPPSSTVKRNLPPRANRSQSLLIPTPGNLNGNKPSVARTSHQSKPGAVNDPKSGRVAMTRSSSGSSKSGSKFGVHANATGDGAIDCSIADVGPADKNMCKDPASKPPSRESLGSGGSSGSPHVSIDIMIVDRPMVEENRETSCHEDVAEDKGRALSDESQGEIGKARSNYLLDQRSNNITPVKLPEIRRSSTEADVGKLDGLKKVPSIFKSSQDSNSFASESNSIVSIDLNPNVESDEKNLNSNIVDLVNHSNISDQPPPEEKSASPGSSGSGKNPSGQVFRRKVTGDYWGKSNNDQLDNADDDDDGLTSLERQFLRCVATGNLQTTEACLEKGVNVHVKNTFDR